MAIIERTYGKETNTVIDEVLISSDSHVIEPEGLWKKQLPKAFQERAPDFGGQRPNDTPGGAQDKNKRVSEMAADGVSAEVLYPTHGLGVLEPRRSRAGGGLLPGLQRLAHRLLQRRARPAGSASLCCRCTTSMTPSRSWSAAARPACTAPSSGRYRQQSCRLPRIALRQASGPPPRIIDLPVNLHILSGHGYSQAVLGLGDRCNRADHRRVESPATASTRSWSSRLTALYDLIFSGVLERYPRLKVVLVENEIGWIPFLLEQWDYYFKRHGAKREGPGHQAAPQRVLPRPDLRHVLQRRRRRPHLVLVGRRQLHVVQRLPARQLDLAQFSSGCRAGLR